MRVVFRTDASIAIGSGHVMRCLTLANVLRDRGAAVLFVCREHEGHQIDYIRRQGFLASGLPVIERLAAPAAMHHHWLGAKPAGDENATRDAMVRTGFGKADWVIVDHYALDASWESPMRGAGSRIMVIDDIADRAHDCDVLLDQNLVAAYVARYDKLVPQGAAKLLGPRYALLQPEYAIARDCIPIRSSPPRRVLIYFGATDSGNLTGLTLKTFLSLERGDIQLDVIIGQINRHRAALHELAYGQTNVTLHEQLHSLAELMIRADLAIGAGGATSWERLCMRLPSLVVILAENQRSIVMELAKRDLATSLGDAAMLNADRMKEFVVAELQRVAPSAAAVSDHVDGYGVYRVAAHLLADDH